MRLIDADKLVVHLKDEIEGCKPLYCGRTNGKSIAYGTVLGLKSAIAFIEALATIEAEPVVNGKWEWFEEWSPSTTEHPRECDDCGWRCNRCKTTLADMVGGYWDNPDEEPKLNYCPNCGAKMKGAKHEC